MHSTSYLAALGALFAAVAAIPVKRELIVNTLTEVEVVTEVLTATVWVDASDAPIYHSAPYTYVSAITTTSAAPVITTNATPTTSSSVYVAPPVPATTQTSSTSATTTTSSVSSTSRVAEPVYTAPPQPAVPVPATTSSYVAPPPSTTTSSTSQWVATTPAYTPQAPPTTTSVAVTSSVPVTTSSTPGKYSGDITYYDVGLGSCGEVNADSEMVVAMAHGMMDKATMCGKYITMSYQGVTQQAKVVDTCMSCANGDLDLSPSLFKAIAPNGDGRVHGITWTFN